MPLDLATILFGLGAVAVKATAAAGESGPAHPAGVALQIAGELTTVVFAHLATGHVERTRERFAEWLRGHAPHSNQDLERALTRSAILADLFCLMEALPGPLEESEHKSWLQCVKERCPPGLLRRPIQGFFEMADEARIRQAIAACEDRLKELEQDFQPTGIDPRQLLLISDTSDYGSKLGRDSLTALESANGALPNRVQDIFAGKWFFYLRLAFQHEIKENEKVFRIFLAMHQAAGFERLEATVLASETRLHQHMDRLSLPSAAPFAYTLPALGRFVGRDTERGIALARWLAANGPSSSGDRPASARAKLLSLCCITRPPSKSSARGGIASAAIPTEPPKP